MTLEVKPLAEITEEAISVLCRNIGIANTMRFIGQFSTGHGDYTEERREMFANLTIEEIAKEIEQERQRRKE